MRVDLYRRPESGQKFSYLVVPHGKPLPEEVTNVDWQIRQQDLDMQDAISHFEPYHIDEPARQIAEKGYAITSVKHQVSPDELPSEETDGNHGGTDGR